MSSHQTDKSDSLATLIKSDSFSKLEPSIQEQLIQAISHGKDKSGGIMGKLLGNKPSNLAIHTILILCIGLLLLVVVDNIHAYHTGSAINMDLINIVIPVITLSIGYVIGKGAA